MVVIDVGYTQLQHRITKVLMLEKDIWKKVNRKIILVYVRAGEAQISLRTRLLSLHCLNSSGFLDRLRE